MRIYSLSGQVTITVSREEVEAAKDCSLTTLATEMGYTVEKRGAHYSLKEMDSLIIYNDRTWKRWSEKGDIIAGSTIDFVMAFGNVNTVEEAVQSIIDRSIPMSARFTYPERQPQSKPFVLPERNTDQRALFGYLIKNRGLSQEIVHEFVHKGLIYEEASHHNIVYVGKAPDGTVKYAGMRGTADAYGKKFQCDVPGNNKNYGVNIVNQESDVLKVFEAVIDCMSYIDMTGERDTNKLVLGMVADNPLEQFLKDYNHIHEICFCLDNDAAGRKAIYGDEKTQGLKDKYEALGYKVTVSLPETGKDYNEMLQITKQNAESDYRTRGR